LGSGLLNTGGILTLDRTGDWTGTLDGYNAGDLLGQGFSTTSADYYLSATTTNPFTMTAFRATSTTATSTFAGGLTVDGTTLVVDYSSGKVGIGTTNPGQLLNVKSSSAADSIIRTDTYSGNYKTGYATFSIYESHHH